MVGDTFDSKGGYISGFLTRGDGGEAGNNNRGYLKGDAASLVGFIDVNDVMIKAKGLLDATSRKVANSGYSGRLVEYSLGAWRENNLVSQGCFDSAILLSLPAMAYPTAGTVGFCGSMDIICG